MVQAGIGRLRIEQGVLDNCLLVVLDYFVLFGLDCLFQVFYFEIWSEGRNEESKRKCD